MDATLIELLEKELAEHEEAITHIRALLKIKGFGVSAPESVVAPISTAAPVKVQNAIERPIERDFQRIPKTPQKRARRSSRTDDVQFMEFLRVNFAGAFTFNNVMEACGENPPTLHTLRGRFERLRDSRELLAVRYNDSKHYTFLAFPDWVEPDSESILKPDRLPDRADLPVKIQSVKILNNE